MAGLRGGPARFHRCWSLWVVMGVLAAAQGISWLELLVKSFAVFAALNWWSWNAGAVSIWVLLVATAAVSLRYIMVGLSLRDLLNEARWPRAFPASGMLQTKIGP